jgi:hypothetical protein
MYPPSVDHKVMRSQTEERLKRAEAARLADGLRRAVRSPRRATEVDGRLQLFSTWGAGDRDRPSAATEALGDVIHLSMYRRGNR